MRSIRLRTAALALCACAGTLSAQTQPKIWSFRPPLGNAASDSRFTQFVQYDLPWGLVDPQDTTDAQIVSRGTSGTQSGSAIGQRVAQEVKARFASYSTTDISILLTWLGWEGVEGEPGYNTTVSGHLGYLYAHPSDLITYTSGGNSKTRRGLAMTAGRTWMNTWMLGFVSGYKTEIGSSVWSTHYVPQRFVFDQEVPIIGLDMFASGTLAEWADYWNAVKTTTPAGFASTLETLRTAAGVSVPTAPGSWNWDYIGGSAGNQAFYSWWRGVCLQAYAAAMNDAVYDPIRTDYTSAKFSDYDNSLWLDGGPSVTDSGATANVLLEHNSWGSPGDRGVGAVFTAPGSNLQQAPHLYPDWSWYQWETHRWAYPNPTGTVNPPSTEATNYYSSVGAPLPYDYGGGRYALPFGHTPFLISDDENAGLVHTTASTRYAFGYQEYWADYNLRMNRATLDAIVRSYPSSGSKPPIAPWVTMVNQPMIFAGNSGSSMPMVYDGQDAVSGHMAFRTSLDYTYRTLGILRSRGCAEMFLWNDYGPEDPTDTDDATIYSYNRYGPHAQFASNWNQFQRAVGEVWGYVPYAFDGTGVTYGTNNDPSDSSIFNATRLGQIANCEARADKTGTVEMTTTSPGTGTAGTRSIWASTYFTRTVSEATNPDFVDIDAEVIVSQECTLYTYITDRPHSNWFLLGTGPGQINDVEGRATTVTLKTGLNRVHFSIPWSADYFNTSHVIGVALYAVTASSSGTAQLVENVDYVQVYGRYDAPRPRGDYNGDGVADSRDVEMWDDAYAFATNPSNAADPKTKLYSLFLDINRDGVVDATDASLWATYFKPGYGSLDTAPAPDDRRPMTDNR